MDGHTHQDLSLTTMILPCFRGQVFIYGGAFALPISVLLRLSYFSYKYLHTSKAEDKLQHRALV